MGSITKSSRAGAHAFHDPNFAATLSIMPGLGQFYLGQKRKGALFLAVGLINLVLLSVLLFQQSIIVSLDHCATIYHFKANPSLQESLSMLRLGTMPANILLSMIFAFVALAMRDARNTALRIDLKELYPANALGLEEAASGSYVLHVVLIMAAFILAFFFISPPPQSRQFTVIEMVDTELTTLKKAQPTKVKSTHNTQSHGAKSHEAPAQERQKAATSQTLRQSTQASPQKRTPVRQEKLKEAMPPPAMNEPVAHDFARPALKPVAPHPLKALRVPTPPELTNRAITPPTPIRREAKANDAPPMPLPNLKMATAQSTPGPLPTRFQPNAMSLPNPASGNPSQQKNSASEIAAINPQASQVNLDPHQTGAGKAPVPGGFYHNLRQTGEHGAPIPSHSNFSGAGSHPEPIAFGPAVLGNGRFHESDKDTRNGANDKDGPPGKSEPGTIEIDWGPYMSDLQRRIKSHWFPPKNLESVKVVVVFKVSKNGELSNLHLARSSGSASADQRALAAVEDAAPFRALPAGSDPMVDIQFTFDYNVFSGSNRRY